MRGERQMVTARDLIEEAKRRIVILSICVVGLSYLMSLTSTSVTVNLPCAAFLIILFRYFALDFEMRRKAAAYNNRATNGNAAIQQKPLEYPKVTVQKEYWRDKVSSPLVEDAIDQFTRHLVSEWVTGLWYSKLTPDQEGPEELVQLMNGVLGEISHRMRSINLIDLLARDVLHLVCKHLEVFRACQSKIKKELASLSSDQRDMELKTILAAENKLHPLLFSPESEHKVLQHIVDKLVSLTFSPEDLHCSFFRYVVRELLACAVLRPVLNLANPRFINERIEQVVTSVRNAKKGAPTANDSSLSKQSGVTSDDFCPFPDPTSGVELVELKSVESKGSTDKPGKKKELGTDTSKDPLLLVDTRSTRSWSALPSNSVEAGGGVIERSTSGGEWGDKLDYIHRRKTESLAPEHFENMWTKGRDYKRKDTGPSNLSAKSGVVNSSSTILTPKESGARNSSGLNARNEKPQSETMNIHTDRNTLTPPPLTSDEEDEAQRVMAFGETESGSSDNCSADEDNRVTGLDSPTTKVWDGRTNRNIGISHIRHPLESFDRKIGGRTTRGQRQRLHRQQSGRKRSRLGSEKASVLQEVERSSFLSADGQDIHPLKQKVKDDDSSDDYDRETMGRLQSGAAASSSTSLPGSFTGSVNAPQSAFLGDTFFKLRCEVLGANIVQSSSSLFAVYSISVADAENNSWSIKRRYRHFEELHRRLKEYPEYCLHLPPKHFLSTGLDVPVIRERCKLLDEYLKKLLQLPTVSGSIDVWDFLSIDSQTYTFSSAFSILETLPVDFGNKPSANSTRPSNFDGSGKDHLKSRRDHVNSASTQIKNGPVAGLNDKKVMENSAQKKPVKLPGRTADKSGDSDNRVWKGQSPQHHGEKGKESEVDAHLKSELYLDDTDISFPTEWVPPNLSGPILDLVDVVFQLKEGAWIRRKAFWVAKQILQLGMGDALDDWLVEKIQRLHRGYVVASGIKRVEQILWPDGIFITKHPSRQKPAGSGGSSQSPSHSQGSTPKEEDLQKFIEQQEGEADRRAKFVYELMIDNAPAAVISLLGRKEYEHCAKDLYFFLQSSVCLKMLVLDLLQLVLLYAFPELDHTFKQLLEDKQKFGKFKPT